MAVEAFLKKFTKDTNIVLEGSSSQDVYLVKSGRVFWICVMLRQGDLAWSTAGSLEREEEASACLHR